jgi:hypothetical protein
LIGTVAAVVAQAPTVASDSYTTSYNTPLTVAASGLLANDTGFSASTHRLESYDPLSQYGGVVTVAADGSFTYTPRSGFVGLDTFSYTVRNGFGATVGVVSITVTQPTAVANDDTYTLTPHLTFVSPTGVLGNDTGTLTGFGNSLGTANDTVPNGSNFIIAGGAGGRVVLNADGTFTYYPDTGDTNTSATFFYTITGGDTAQVTLTLTNQEQVWVVDSTPSGTVCTGTNVGTPACPFTAFTDAWAGASTANDTILVDSGAYTCGVTVLAGQRVLGAGTSGTVEAATGITPQTGSTYTPYGAFSGTRPTMTTSGTSNCFTISTNNTLHGFDIGDRPNVRVAIAGSNFGTLTISQMAISGTGRVLALNIGTLAATFDSLATTDSSDRGISLTSVAGSLTVTGATNLSNLTDDALSISNSSLQATFSTLDINIVTGANSYGLLLDNNTNAAFSFTANGGTIQNTSSHNLNMVNSGNLSLTDMTFDTPVGSANNIRVENPRGTNSLTRVTLNNSPFDGLNISATSGTTSTWTLTDVDCTTAGTNTTANCVVAAATSAATLNLSILGTAIGESVLRSRDNAVSVSASGTNTQIRLNMDRVRLTDPVGASNRRGGLQIQASGGGAVTYVVQRSEFTNLYPDNLNSGMVLLTTGTNGSVRGRFSNNTITSTASSTNNAIRLALSVTNVFELDLHDNTASINGSSPVFQILMTAATFTDVDVRVADNSFTQNSPTLASTQALSLVNGNGTTGDARFLFDGNTFTTNDANTTSAALVTTSSGAGALPYSVTLTDNTFNSGNSVGDLFLQTISATSTMCAAATGNTGTAPARLRVDRTGGTFNVANLAGLATDNPSMTVTVTGTVNDVASCPAVALSGTIPAFPSLLP